MPIPRGVIFDLFHTLTRVPTPRSGTAASSGPPDLPPEIDRDAFTKALLELASWRLTGQERDPVAIVRRAAALASPGVSDVAVAALAKSRIDAFRRSLRDIPPENVETIRAIRRAGFRVGLLSNADAVEIAGWSDSPLAGLFDVEIFSCSVGYVKPDPEIYQLCLNQLGLPAGECWFVGDGASHELQGARTVGIVAVFMSGVVEALWPEFMPTRIQVADYRIRSIPDLRPLLDLPPA